MHVRIIDLHTGVRVSVEVHIGNRPHSRTLDTLLIAWLYLVCVVTAATIGPAHFGLIGIGCIQSQAGAANASTSGDEAGYSTTGPQSPVEATKATP